MGELDREVENIVMVVPSFDACCIVLNRCNLRLRYFTIGRTVNSLGLLYADLGRIDEAEKTYLRALQGKEKA
jgi:hypothetical protein